MKIVSQTKLERGLAYGEACFETFRVIDGEIFARQAHRKRLAAGLAEFGIVLSGARFGALFAAARRAAAAVADDALVRLTVAGGEAPWGLTAAAAEPIAYLQAVPAPVPVAAAAVRLKTWPFPLRPKPAKFSADYAELLRLLRGSTDLDLLFEQHGLLIAGASANLLLYRDGCWWTPEAGSGVLPGVVRAHLIAAGVVREAACPALWLEDCEAAALCNSGSFIRPIAKVRGVADLDPRHPALNPLREALAGHAGVPKDI